MFNGDSTPQRIPTMQGFVKSYFAQRRDVEHSRKIMYYFTPEKLPVLTTLATEFAVFNRWFSSIPGPTLCNRAFAHYGTSFGHVGMEVFYANQKFKSIYERLESAGRRAKIYYFDTKSSSLEVDQSAAASAAVLRHLRISFSSDCDDGVLPNYSLHRAELQRPRRRGRRRGACLRPAPRSSRAGGRALHRHDLQRDSAERRRCGPRPRC